MVKLWCFLFIVWIQATLINGNIRLTAPICDDPVLNTETQAFTMKCRAENVTNDPVPKCTVRHQGDGAPVSYQVDYNFTPACCGSDLFIMYCDIKIKAEDLTCGVEYKFTVAATLYGGAISSGGAVYSSPVTYGEFGSCPKVELTTPICDDPVLNNELEVFTMKCRTDNVSQYPRPRCDLYYQSEGTPVFYNVDYTYTPACCGLMTMSCNITMNARDFTCGVEYSFAVAATMYDGKLSSNISDYSSPVTYGEFGSCPKVELTTPICDDPVLNEQDVFTMKCRAENVSQYPRPHCDLYYQSEGTLDAYRVNYGYTPACCGSDLMTLSCNITMNARDFTCGVEYSFAVAATAYEGKLSSNTSDISSPVTYGELGNCPKAPTASTTPGVTGDKDGTTTEPTPAVTSTLPHQTTVTSTTPAVTEDKDGKTTKPTTAVTSTPPHQTTVTSTTPAVTEDKDGKTTKPTTAVTSTPPHQTTVSSTTPAVTEDKDGKTSEPTSAVTSTPLHQTTVGTTLSSVTSDKDVKTTEPTPIVTSKRPSQKKLTPPICDDPVLNNETDVFTMKCRAENVTFNPTPECKVSRQGKGGMVPYDVDYSFKSACCESDLFTMFCNIKMNAHNFICGEEYRFAVAAILFGGELSAGGAKYSSPVTYDPDDKDCKSSGPKAAISSLLLFFMAFVTFYSFI